MVRGDGVPSTQQRRGNERRTGKESTPDVTLASAELEGRCKWRVATELGSDHRPIVVEVGMEREVKEEGKSFSWAWKRADWERFQRECDERMRRVEVGKGSLSEQVRGLTVAMVEAAKAAIPLKRVSRFNRPFWDEELTSLQERRNAARRAGNEEEWRRINQELEEKYGEKRREYWKGFVEELGKEEDVGRVWKTTNTSLDRKSVV